MKKQYLEAGVISGVHGVRGEVRVDPWCDSPEFLCSFQTLYLDEKPVRILRAFPNKNAAVLHLEGVDNHAAAEAMRGKILCIDRSDAVLPEGAVFVQDLIGLDAVDAETGQRFGVIRSVDDYPAGNVYVIDAPSAPGGEVLIPAVPEFVIEKNPDGGYVKFKVLSGMFE